MANQNFKQWLEEEVIPREQRLNDEVFALLRYANEETGGNDTTLGAAMIRLVQGYGQGGGGSGIDKVQIAELHVTWGNSTVSDIGRATPSSLDFDTIICEHYSVGRYRGCQIKSLIPNSDKSYDMGFVDQEGFVTGSYGKLTATNPTTDNPEIVFGWNRIGGGYYHPTDIKIYTAKVLHFFTK